MLPDTADYVKFKKLQWDRLMVEQERKNPNAFIRAMLIAKARFLHEEEQVKFEHRFEPDDSSSESDEKELEAPPSPQVFQDNKSSARSSSRHKITKNGRRVLGLDSY